MVDSWARVRLARLVSLLVRRDCRWACSWWRRRREEVVWVRWEIWSARGAEGGEGDITNGSAREG